MTRSIEPPSNVRCIRYRFQVVLPLNRSFLVRLNAVELIDVPSNYGIPLVV